MINKQEVIEKIEARKRPLVSGKTFDHALDIALNIVKQLDEPEKPVVPQFVADWYEDNKDDFEYNVYFLCVKFYENELKEEIKEWFNSMDNKPIETLVDMHKFGYEVEKEKKYRMKRNLTGEYLCFTLNKSFHSDDLNWYTEIKRTQKEWEDMGYWDNDLYESEEVLND